LYVVGYFEIVHRGGRQHIQNLVVNGYVEGRVYLLFAGGFCVGIVGVRKMFY
jgi:hypothetical protein